jgi:type IV pilus assembly protein PilP
MTRIACILILVFSLVAPLGGCSKDTPPPRKPAAKKSAQRPAQTDAKAAEEVKKFVPEHYAYNAKGRRDPFYTLIMPTQEKPTKKAGASPMESYGVDQIQLMAVAKDYQRYYALIRLPDKKTYTILEGMTLGLQDGKVTQITRDGVYIREYVKDFRGNIKPKDTFLKLHKGGE